VFTLIYIQNTAVISSASLREE